MTSGLKYFIRWPRKMDHVRSFCCCDKSDTNLWRGTSIAIGWFCLIASTWLVFEVIFTPARDSLIVSIIYTILVIFLNVNVYACKYLTILLCVLNMIACVTWLCGNAKNITECMLASLMWWGVELGFFLISVTFFIFLFGLSDTIFYYSAWKFEHFFLIISTVISVAFYIIAIISFKSIKKSVETYSVECPLLNVAYANGDIEKFHPKEVEEM